MFNNLHCDTRKSTVAWVVAMYSSANTVGGACATHAMVWSKETYSFASAAVRSNRPAGRSAMELFLKSLRAGGPRQGVRRETRDEGARGAYTTNAGR